MEVQYGVSRISDRQLTASATIDSLRNEAEGRLYGPFSWCTREEHKSYFEIDLQTPREVVGIATQGDPNGDNYIQEYDIHHSFTSDMWIIIEVRNPRCREKLVSTSH